MADFVVFGFRHLMMWGVADWTFVINSVREDYNKDIITVYNFPGTKKTISLEPTNYFLGAKKTISLAPTNYFPNTNKLFPYC